MKNKKGHLLVPVLILLCIVSCKSPEESVTKIALTKQSKEERIHNLLDQGLRYQYFVAPCRVSLKMGEGGKRNSFNGQLRIKKDEAIQLSLLMPILGSEIVRIVITPDQVILLDRYHKMYVRESMDAIRRSTGFDFDYYSLQALFTNHLFIAGKQVVSESDFTAFSIDTDQFQVRLHNADSQGISYDFISDYTHRIQKAEMYKDKDSASMTWEYLDFGLTSDKRLFPMAMNMNLNASDMRLEANFNFSGIDLNKTFEPDKSIPSKYEQIALKQIIQLIKSL